MKLKNAGFSLVEIMVAITIGGVILATVMGTYLSLARTKQRLDISRKIQREINFATMRISDRVRAYSVNYNEFDKFDHNSLPLGDDLFKYLPDEKVLTMNGATLFSPQLNVSEVNFLVTPEDLDPSQQVRVQIELLISSIAKPEISIPLRTTISSRSIQ